MTQLTRLLATTDLSAPARHAADRAALLASEARASLALLHVASLAPLEKLRRLVAALPPGLEQHVLDVARTELDDLAEALHRHHGVRATTHVAAGPLPAEVAAHAEAWAADLIVLGARGASFMRHALLGSTAERMLGTATRPMLVVKQTAHERYRTVLVPVDFSPASLSSLKLARAVAPLAEIVLLHVFDVPFEGKLRYAGVNEASIEGYRTAARREALQRLRALSDEAALPPRQVRLLALEGAPAPHIVEQEQEQDCDLIVMGKHGESQLEAFLLGSVTRRVLGACQCDVLVSV